MQAGQAYFAWPRKETQVEELSCCHRSTSQQQRHTPYSKRCLPSDVPWRVSFPCTQQSKGENGDHFGEDRRANLEVEPLPENVPGENKTHNLIPTNK